MPKFSYQRYISADGSVHGMKMHVIYQNCLTACPAVAFLLADRTMINYAESCVQMTQFQLELAVFYVEWCYVKRCFGLNAA